MARGYLLFHLNLAFSSIEEESRSEVLDKCYWPLLEFADNSGIPVGIELSGWTLQQIAMLDPSWIDSFRKLLENRSCELIGSGWSQMIGPLAPYDVNCWNQKLGLRAYEEILQTRPGVALVNEMAFSSGLVEVYVNAGYEAIVMDRDNVRLALELDHAPILATPTHASGDNGLSIPVLWSDSILFQRLQRVVHGDIPVREYMDYIRKRIERDNAVLPIYCNDVEIFNYRPGRFATESRLHPEGEWKRLKDICEMLQTRFEMEWLSPGQALANLAAETTSNARKITSILQPVPVKKQAKYNVNRWTVTGRNDLWLNTTCHRIYQVLSEGYSSDEAGWRKLCELWSSDLRTHITEKRWASTLENVQNLSHQYGLDGVTDAKPQQKYVYQAPESCNLSEDIDICRDDEDIYWSIKTPCTHLTLNARRGITIQSLAFRSHEFKPVIGTLPQGHFESIELGADFYSGGVIIEIPGERVRITDLEWVQPSIQQIGNELVVSARISNRDYTIDKVVTINTVSERVKLSYDFAERERPLGTVRVGMITLLPEWYSSNIRLTCRNGGKEHEQFELDRVVNHARAASTLVSSTAAFGATDGRITIEDLNQKGIAIEWNPSECAAVPMLHHQLSKQHYLTRLLFSLCELDDTSRTGGVLMPFSFEIAPLP